MDMVARWDIAHRSCINCDDSAQQRKRGSDRAGDPAFQRVSAPKIRERVEYEQPCQNLRTDVGNAVRYGAPTDHGSRHQYQPQRA
jgi:hypothetical protein